MASPSVTRATAELDYPLYALDFDPEDANCLIVGGGGGAGRHGIPNKITVLTTPSHDELRIAGEMTLPSEEDSVMSLAVGRAQRQKAVRFYAGVNSSQADLAKGINQHLRTLVLEHPPKTRSSSSASNSPLSASSKGPRALVKMTELSRTALFTNPDPDNYQRRLRIAGPVGVTALELGKDPQIAVFDAVGAKPKPRGVLELPRHASDLDIIQTGEDRFQLAFCYDDQVHVVNISEHSGEPELVFSMPEDHGQRPVLRLIRYLTPEFILAASNLPQKGGLLIQALRLPSASHGKARVATAVRIPRKALATALAVANLSPTWPAWSPAGSTQFVIALGASDSSTCLYTLEHRPSTAINLLFDLHHTCTLTGKLSVTSLSFSTLTPSKTHTRPHSIKLASIYMGGLVAVDNVPLKKHIDQAPRKSKGPPGPTRHVVAIRSRGPSSRPLIIALTLIVLVMALVGRAVMEMYGRNEPVVLANRFFHSWHGTLASPELRPSVPMVPDFITKLAGGKRTFSPGQTVVIFEAPLDQTSRTSIQVGVHDAHVHEPAKTWDELSVEQRLLWRRRLRDAGAWTQAMGESVFKGILFGQIAGAIGRAMDT